jgi:hypothetical protein
MLLIILLQRDCINSAHAEPHGWLWWRTWSNISSREQLCSRSVTRNGWELGRFRIGGSAGNVSYRLEGLPWLVKLVPLTKSLGGNGWAA